MKQLTCEMCGSNNLVKQDGVFVCQNCGTKYSVEEAKKMMIEGTIRFDNSHLINNYFEIARNAYASGNHIEAESYSNKIIEIDPSNYNAWILKGKAAAWQSTLSNLRIPELISSFSKAVLHAPNEEKGKLTEEIETEIKNLSRYIISLRGEQFAKWPNEEETVSFLAEIDSVMNCAVQFIAQSGKDINKSDIMRPSANVINQYVVKAWSDTIFPEYNGDPNDSDDRPGKYEWEIFITQISYCVVLEEKAISLCDEDDEDNIQRYSNLIFLHKTAIDSCSWNYNITNWGKEWYKDWKLSDEAKMTHQTLIQQYERKIESIKTVMAEKEAVKEQKAKAEAKMRIYAYWIAHAEEKANLECELTALKEQIEAYNSQMNDPVTEINKGTSSLSGNDKIAVLEEKIKKLADEKTRFGIFKVKEKKEIQEQIDELLAEKTAIEAEISKKRAEIQNKINILQDRIDVIYSELTKDR